MEYLVTMTTHVPDGVSEREVDEVRAKEGAHTRQLARDGRVLRLWRPPLQPGEWRTLGLFDAAGPEELEAVLASMPLRVWRTDSVTALTEHPNDPGRGRVSLDPDAQEFLVWMTLRVPAGTSPDAESAVAAREAQRAAELADGGQLVRLWRLPDKDHNLGHWQARDPHHMADLLAALPMAPWLDVETVALTRHPSDPGVAVTG
jgi:muconolactone delta-isomerase